MTTRHAVTLDRVSKTYTDGDRLVRALDEVSLAIPAGRFLAVMGPSGSGKSTLLHCAAGLVPPTAGEVTIGGVGITQVSEARRTTLRRERVGFVFQEYNLVPSLSIEHNITLPLRLAGRTPDHARLRSLIDRVGLSGLLRRRPAELSGGQQQRAAIARALAIQPDVIFADEPTGALDLASTTEVLELLRGLADDAGQTVVMVTHDAAAAARAHDVLVMADGRIVDIMAEPPAEVLARRLTALAIG